jgi:hypothetical protein
MWQDDFLDEIRQVDREQAPHGLYGMRMVLAEEFREKQEKGFPPLARLLGGRDPRTGIAQRLGWIAGGGRSWRSTKNYQQALSFTFPGAGEVMLRLEGHASTKVRHYGNSYALDKVHGKKPEESPEFLESVVPHLRKHAKLARTTPGLRFIAHVQKARSFVDLLGKTADAVFLERYGLSFHSRTWEDIHGRGFHTGLFLWVADVAR